MSQESLPTTVGTAFSQESNISGISNPSEDVLNWTKPNPKIDSLFCLIRPGADGSRVHTGMWRLFHIVKGVKDGVDESDLPNKWVTKPVANHWVCCNMCGAFLTKGKEGKSQTTHGSLIGHLVSGVHGNKGRKRILYELGLAEAEQQSPGSNKKRKQQTLISKFGNYSTLTKKDRERLQDIETVKFICKSFLPFSTVDSEYFRSLIKCHNHTAKVMTKQRLKSIISELEFEMRDMMIDKLKDQSVSITLDHWTSKGHDNYTGMTVHYIDEDWTLQSSDIGLFLHQGGSKAEELKKDFEEVMIRRLKLKDTCLTACTTDTAPNMNSFGQLLEELGIVHVYCGDHEMHSTCKLAYSTNTQAVFGAEYSESYSKAKAHIHHYNQSTQATEKLKETQRALPSIYEKNPVGVVDDVVTRWWSTYSAIERLLYLKTAITTMHTDSQMHSVEQLTPNDWKRLQEIMRLLKPFKEAQKFLEGDHYVNGSLVSHVIYAIRGSLEKEIREDQGNEGIGILASSLLRDFNKRWKDSSAPVYEEAQNGAPVRASRNRQTGIHPVLCLATFLDPRTKSLACIDEASKVAIKKRILALMIASESRLRIAEADAAAGNEDAEASTDGSIANTRDNTETQDDGDSTIFGFIDMLEQQEDAADASEDANVSTIEVDCKNEFNRYKDTKRLPWKTANNTNSNPLLWWKANASRFPILARLARIYLAVQPSSAPSERIFSVASRLLSARRTTMDPRFSGKAFFGAHNWEWFEREFGSLAKLLVHED